MRWVPGCRGFGKRTAPRSVAVEAPPLEGVGWIAGEFDLPVVAIWGDYILPSGSYAFVVLSRRHPSVVYLHGPEGDALIEVESLEMLSIGGSNELALVRIESQYYVRSLVLAGPGVRLQFAVPAPPPSLAQPSPRSARTGIGAREPAGRPSSPSHERRAARPEKPSRFSTQPRNRGGD